MNENATPFACHIFVCSNCRENKRKSCAHDGAQLVKLLKKEVKERGLKEHVRVSRSGCLGVCDDGPNVMIYPEGVWYKNVALEDTEDILSFVEKTIGS